MPFIGKSIALCLLASLFAVSGFSQQQPPPQEPKSVLAFANGTGTIKLSDEEFKVTAVVVKLIEDGKAELIVVSDITIFMSGTWTRSTESANVINLEITAGATGGGVQASGALYLRDDNQTERRSIDRVSFQGESKTTHKAISLDFKAK
jgi:hypothetical protein